MQKIIIFLSFFIVLSGSLDAAPGFKMPKAKMPGVVGKLITAISKMPKELEKLMKTTLKMSRIILESRKFMLRPDPTKLQELSFSLQRELMVLQMSIDKFRINVVYVSLENAGKMCNTMPITAAMAMPYVGTAVAGMCGRVGFVEAKVLAVLANAELKVSEGMTIVQNIEDKIGVMQQAGGMGGLAQAGMNAGMNAGMAQGATAMQSGMPGNSMMLPQGLDMQNDAMGG